MSSNYVSPTVESVPTSPDMIETPTNMTDSSPIESNSSAGAHPVGQDANTGLETAVADSQDRDGNESAGADLSTGFAAVVHEENIDIDSAAQASPTGSDRSGSRGSVGEAPIRAFAPMPWDQPIGGVEKVVDVADADADAVGDIFAAYTDAEEDDGSVTSDASVYSETPRSPRTAVNGADVGDETAAQPGSSASHPALSSEARAAHNEEPHPAHEQPIEDSIYDAEDRPASAQSIHSEATLVDEPAPAQRYLVQGVLPENPDEEGAAGVGPPAPPPQARAPVAPLDPAAAAIDRRRRLQLAAAAVVFRRLGQEVASEHEASEVDLGEAEEPAAPEPALGHMQAPAPAPAPVPAAIPNITITGGNNVIINGITNANHFYIFNFPFISNGTGNGSNNYSSGAAPGHGQNSCDDVPANQPYGIGLDHPNIPANHRNPGHPAYGAIVAGGGNARRPAHADGYGCAPNPPPCHPVRPVAPACHPVHDQAPVQAQPMRRLPDAVVPAHPRNAAPGVNNAPTHPVGAAQGPNLMPMQPMNPPQGFNFAPIQPYAPVEGAPAQPGGGYLVYVPNMYMIPPGWGFGPMVQDQRPPQQFAAGAPQHFAAAPRPQHPADYAPGDVLVNAAPEQQRRYVPQASAASNGSEAGDRPRPPPPDAPDTPPVGTGSPVGDAHQEPDGPAPSSNGEGNNSLPGAAPEPVADDHVSDAPPGTANPNQTMSGALQETANHGLWSANGHPPATIALVASLQAELRRYQEADQRRATEDAAERQSRLGASQGLLEGQVNLVQAELVQAANARAQNASLAGRLNDVVNAVNDLLPAIASPPVPDATAERLVAPRNSAEEAELARIEIDRVHARLYEEEMERAETARAASEQARIRQEEVDRAALEKATAQQQYDKRMARKVARLEKQRVALLLQADSEKEAREMEARHQEEMRQQQVSVSPSVSIQLPLPQVEHATTANTMTMLRPVQQPVSPSAYLAHANFYCGRCDRGWSLEKPFKNHECRQ